MRMTVHVGVTLGLLWASFSACKHAEAETQSAPGSYGRQTALTTRSSRDQS